MARIAANYAGNNAEEFSVNDPATLALYQKQIINDAKNNNCRIHDTSGTNDKADAPVFSGYEVGDTATVSLTCTFQVATPIISNIVGIDRHGVRIVAVPGEDGDHRGHEHGRRRGRRDAGHGLLLLHAEERNHVALWSNAMTNRAAIRPTGRGRSRDRAGPRRPARAGPPVHPDRPRHVLASAHGDNALNQPSTLTFVTTSPRQPVHGRLHRRQVLGTGPADGPVLGQSSNTPLTWAWDFDNNGSVDRTSRSRRNLHESGQYDVKLTVTYASGTYFKTKPIYIDVGIPDCNVPSFTRC